MKHLTNITLSVLLITTLSVASFAQDDPVRSASELVDQKLYDSAMNVLIKADPNNQNPEIVIAKTDIFLDYFVTSMMHQMFALKDLNEDEDILDVRGSEGIFSMYYFPVDSIISGLIEKFPENFDLYHHLGYFYHEVHLKYGDGWLIPDQEVVEKFTENYRMAYDHGVFDYWSAYGLGYSCLMSEKFEESIPYFEKSIELNDEYPSGHYNLAYAYLYMDNYNEAMAEGIRALELYADSSLKADAAQIVAVAYEYKNELPSSYRYYLIADSLSPNNYYFLKPLLNLELYLNEDIYHERTLDFFQLDPGNPTIYQDLQRIYFANNKAEELIGFLESQEMNYQEDKEVLGNIQFYIGGIYYNLEKNQKAKKHFKEAREIFNEVFEPDHYVFEVIETYLQEL